MEGELGFNGIIAHHVFAKLAEPENKGILPLEVSEQNLGKAGNGLRERNPGKLCKQCGKGFRSLKALCGHMASHSEKNRDLRYDSCWTSEKHKTTAMDGFSDTDQRRLRSRSTKSKKRKSVPENSLFSSVSEIDEQEQEEVALCLMLLSRDCRSKGGVFSAMESSENNSVFLETSKSSSSEIKRIGFPPEVYTTDSGYFLDSDEDFRAEAVNKSLRSSAKISPPEKKTMNNKGHVCPFCNRAFKNGQALGGHKRSHFIIADDEARNRTPLLKPELLDLNLPAPEAVEDGGHAHRLSW